MNRVFNKNNNYFSCLGSVIEESFNYKTNTNVRYAFWARVKKQRILTLGELLS